ncbi:hypothetical protein EG329_012135 [Mollisiaceae sp. DMI_Dod_QoI]|nr:hypothetical protein EG329_012135 [Helotiales sp. DMI_Dod_QoI]
MSSRIKISNFSKEEKAKEWVRSLVEYKKDFYLVVGLQELKEAKFQRVIKHEVNRERHFPVPLDNIGQLCIEAGAKISGVGFGKAETTLSEVVGIEVMKVKCRVGKVGELGITDQISWVYAQKKTKGAKEEELEQISVQLGELAARLRESRTGKKSTK